MGIMAARAGSATPFGRIRLTWRALEAHYHFLVMMARNAARAAVLTNVAVRLFLLVLLLGILPGGFVV